MKAKKLLFGLLSILCFGFSTFALASCGEQSTEIPTEQPTQQPTNEPHVHEWNEGEIVDNATCTEAGLIAFKCKTCEETKLDVISALGHTEVIDAAVAATCTKTGLTEGKHCSVCNEVLVVRTIVEALGHKYIDYVCSECDYNYYTEGLEFTLSDEYYAITGYHGDDTNIVIPSVYNDKPVTTIGIYAFSDCSSLESVTIGNNVTSIGTFAFASCSSLTSITIPDSVTSIGEGAFASCSSLKSITIGNNVTSIGVCAFASCSSLTNIVIPESVTSIGGWAFSDCSSLTNIFIPESVTSIGEGAFWDCSSVTSIMVDENNNNYDSKNNCNAIIEASTNTLIVGCKNTIIPNSVTSIGECAFAGCISLTSIEFPDGVTSIGDDAFYGCSSLTSITIPNSVTHIGEYAFYGCSSLTTVYYTGTEEQWNNIYIDSSGNEALKNVTIIYNYVPEEEQN